MKPADLIHGRDKSSRREENIHRHYETASYREPKPVTPSDHVCCTDVWSGLNYFSKTKSLSRICTKNETYQINFYKVFAKQLVSGFLFAIVAWYIYITANLRDSVEGQNFSFPALFDCDPDSPSSAINVDDIEDDFVDEGVQFCYFKSVMIILSFALLFPFMLETISVLTIVWVSSINLAVLVPIVDGKYVGKDAVFNNVFSINVFERISECLFVWVSVPREILKLNNETETPVPKWLLLTEMFWKLFVFMLPDVLLTGSLFFVSYYVMIGSDSPEDVLVNLVAVQVFAELDDIFVRMMFAPRTSCGERVASYVTENPHSAKAVYSPFQAYLLNEVRHQMGIRVPRNNAMFYYHDYSGHHLTARKNYQQNVR